MKSPVGDYDSSGNISKRFADGGTCVDPKTERNFSEPGLASLNNGTSVSKTTRVAPKTYGNNESRLSSLKQGNSFSRATSRPPLIGSCRLILSVVSSLGLLNFYTLRFNMTVAMTWMVDQNALLESELMLNKTTQLRHATCTLFATHTNNTSMNLDKLRMYDSLNGEFVWSADVQNTIRSSFYWGYIWTQIPGGWLAERYGGKRFIGWSFLIASIINLLIPTATRLGYQFLIALRVLQGIVQGVMWPSMFVIWARWAPPPERQKLTSLCFSGSILGIAITFPAVVILAESKGVHWPAVFYISGICGIVWTLVWYRFVYDSPLIHPRISEQEKNYIHRSLRKTITLQLKNQPPTPWKALLTSVPVWNIVACNTFNGFTVYFLIDSMFDYATNVIGYNNSLARMLDTIPNILFFVISVLAGAIYDSVTNSRTFSRTRARKFSNTIGTVVPAILVLAAGFTDCEQGVYAIILIIACTSICGIQYGAGFLCNLLDIAPQHSGVIYGMANMASVVAGVSEPYLLSSITKDHMLSQWRNLFTLLALLFLVEAAIFELCGTAELQEWALPPREEERSSHYNNTSCDHLQQLKSTTLQSGVKLDY